MVAGGGVDSLYCEKCLLDAVASNLAMIASDGTIRVNWDRAQFDSSTQANPMRCSCILLFSRFLVVLCAIASALLVCPIAFAKQSNDQPNIVMIVADDLGVFDLGCYGRRDHSTPHLDKLAAEGFRYTNAYCSLSICSASRASLMTGKSCARLHLTTFLPGRPDADSQLLLQPRIQSHLPLAESTLAEWLQTAGYRTGLFGKWHLGGGKTGPLAQGFEVAMEPKGNGAVDEKEGGKNEYAIVDSAIAFLRAQDAKPSFCYIPQHSPHVALSAPQALIDKNANSFNPLYAATVESLDNAIGKLMAAVDALKRPTLVIFTSDNGGLHVPEVHELPATHNGPFRAGKGYLYEGGIRIPLIVRWSDKINSGQTIDSPVSLMDLMPTLMEVAGLELGKTVGPLDGVSLKAGWLPNPTAGPEKERSFFWHFPHYTNQGSRPAAATRQGQWKLIESLEDGSIELYDLQKDVGEKNNIAQDNVEKAKLLADSLHTWQRRMGVQFCVPNPNANPDLHRKLYTEFDPTRLDASVGAMAIGAKWKAWRNEMNRAVSGKKAFLKDASQEILLTAASGTAHGKKLRYEPETYKNVIGYWTEVDDWVDWELTVPKDGTYEIEVHCGCGSNNGGSVARLDVGSQSLQWTVRDTGHFQNIIIENIGTMKLAAGTYRLAVRPQSKKGAAVMDIRSIVLRLQ